MRARYYHCHEPDAQQQPFDQTCGYGLEIIGHESHPFSFAIRI